MEPHNRDRMSFTFQDRPNFLVSRSGNTVCCDRRDTFKTVKVKRLQVKQFNKSFNKTEDFVNMYADTLKRRSRKVDVSIIMIS